MKLLKILEDSGFDIQSQLKIAAGIVEGSKKETLSAYHFLLYAQEYWLFHTKASTSGEVACYPLWLHLAGGTINTVRLP